MVSGPGRLLPTGICMNGCLNCLITDSGPHAGNRGVDKGGGGGGGGGGGYSLSIFALYGLTITIYGEN